jgi:hypothetical protein
VSVLVQCSNPTSNTQGYSRIYTTIEAAWSGITNNMKQYNIYLSGGTCRITGSSNGQTQAGAVIAHYSLAQSTTISLPFEYVLAYPGANYLFSKISLNPETMQSWCSGLPGQRVCALKTASSTVSKVDLLTLDNAKECLYSANNDRAMRGMRDCFCQYNNANRRKQVYALGNLSLQTMKA